MVLGAVYLVAVIAVVVLIAASLLAKMLGGEEFYLYAGHFY